MEKVYACLLGKWVCLNDDPNCKIGNNGASPSSWWMNGAQSISLQQSVQKKMMNPFICKTTSIFIIKA